MTILPLLASNPFGPDEVNILAAALDDAWETIKRSGSVLASPRYESGTRDVLAAHIMELAKRGILDRHQLAADAVAHLASSYRDRADGDEPRSHPAHS